MTQAYSVTINESERRTMVDTITAKLKKLIASSEPDPDFYPNISKRLYARSLEKFTPETIKYVYHISNHTSHNFRFVRLAAIKDDNPNDTTPVIIKNIMTGESSNLLDITGGASDTRVTSAELQPDLRSIPFAFEERPRSTSQTLIVDKDFLAEIKQHNEEYDIAIDPIRQQLAAVVDTIEKCRSTKQFEAKLPGLTHLYPESVKQKLIRKAEARKPVQTALTDEEKLLNEVATSLSAVELLE